MAYNPNPMAAAGAYEQSQGPESHRDTSPEELRAFYEDMERTEVLERKLSKRKSGSGTSRWSLKSFKRSTIGASILPTSPDVPRIPSKANINDTAPHKEATQDLDQGDRKGGGRQLASSRSVIVDTRETPAWMENSAWAAVPLPTFKVTYPLHNPLGPRWYRNHHLIPPSQKRPSMRPPTFFSPSFPPMHSSSSPEHALDDSEGHSRTPADSPLPTPTSSQTRVADGGKARSRKTSQTTPDNVDLLDLTDPWGQNWHHQSPYDFGQPSSSSADAYEVPNRTRRASMTAMQNRHNPVTPSPLSQSTSAVHLHPLQPEIHVPRKLSKRRTPTVDVIFNRKPPDVEKADKKVTSAPPTPIERVQMPPNDYNPASLPKRMAVAPPLSNSAIYSQQTSKKEKRGSMLDRLARKFSKIRKSVDERGTGVDYWENSNSQEVKGYSKDPGPPHNFGRSSPEKSRPESLKRVPPPSVEHPPELAAPEINPLAHRISMSSLEASYSMGRLTVANPDQDTSETDIPPPPPEKAEQPCEHEAPPPGSSVNRCSLQAHRTSVDVLPRLEKPLPPPQIPTPHFSVLGLPELDADTPKVVEQPLPPPPTSQEPTPQPSQHKSLPAQPPHITDHETPQRASTPPQQQRKVSGSTEATGSYSNKADVSVVSAPQIIARQASSSSYPTDSGNETPVVPVVEAVGPSRTQSPLLQSSYASYELLQKATTQSQRPPQSRKTTPTRSPEPAPAPPTKHERAPTSQPVATSHHHSSRDTRERAPEPSSNRHTSKQIWLQSHSEAVSHLQLPPKPQAIPFPSRTDHIQFEASPLSTSSMLANPPTPYDIRDLILTPDQSPPPSLPPKSIYEGKEGRKADHNTSPIRTSAIANPSPTNPSPSRQTETFKLVRSKSGNVYASGQTITAAGQQWEVVESLESNGRKEKQSRAKDPDQDRRSREHERRSRGDYEVREVEGRARAEREHRSKDHEQRRSERKSRDYERGKESEKVKVYERPKEYEQPREHDRPKEYERSREHERSRDREKSREHDRPKDYERLREHDKPRDVERSRKHDRPREHEKSRVYDKPKEQEKSKGHERSKEYETPTDYDRPRDYEKLRDHHGKARDYSAPKEPEKPREHSKPKDRERSKEYNYEWSKDRERLKEYERSRDYRRSKDRDLPKEPEASNRREVVEPKPQIDMVSKPEIHRSSHKAAKQSVYQEEPPKGRSHARAITYQQVDDSSQDVEKKSSRRREGPLDRKHDSHRPADGPSSSNHRHNPPLYPVIPIVVQPSDQFPPPHVPLERNPSLTARPTSEMPLAAEMNAMRAKESWEMERLWKARSMYGLEPNAPTTNFIQSPGSSSSRSDDDVNTHSAVHGSAHTAYVVPTPFQDRHTTQIYHSMPTAPPPIIYSSPASIPSIPDFLSSYDPYEQQQHNYQAYQSSAVDYRGSPAAALHEARPTLNNPLPDPPRESPFNPNKATLKSNNKRTNDNWTKYNGITTAH